MASGTKAHELDEMNDVDLETRLREAKEELFNLRFQAATGQLESHGRLRTVKKDIARIYTVVRERELCIRSDPDARATASDNEEAPNEGADARPTTQQLRPAKPARCVRAWSSATRWTRPSWSRSRTA